MAAERSLIAWLNTLLVQAPVRLVRRVRYLHRRSVAFVVYAAVTAIAYTLAFLLRFEFSWPAEYTETFLRSLPVLILIRHGCHLLFRLTTSRWRFAGVTDVARLVCATVLGSILFLPLARENFLPMTVPLSVMAGEAMLSVGITSAIWIAYRSAFDALRYRQGGRWDEQARVLIIGAGESGYMLAREMMRRHTGQRPVGFVDDDPHKWGTRLAGLEVIGSTYDLARIARSYGVEELILAVPYATPAQLRVLVEKCEQVQLPYRVLPSIREVLAGHVTLEQVREVQIEDLLGREPVNLELQELSDDLSGARVLVTGAAGSIGSELSRQLALHSPSQLILLDQAETDLFFLERHIRDAHPHLDVAAIVGDIVDASGTTSVFDRFRPTHVFHAAAYKHVPMMEMNVREAVRNNVLGTRIVAEAAARSGAGKFVLVSTDKAVQPANVMGATKRLAEVTVLQMQDRYPHTSFTAVRFGNVLGSNGSVIPLFKMQIAEGKPLTVTDPEVTRYFMTIPEAVQLILQASLLPEVPGHIAMLEMGEPVRILDLARNLLRLSGTRAQDTSITFTGLRAGEKLHEELVAPDEETVATSIPKVRLVRSRDNQEGRIVGTLERWEREAFELRPEELLDNLCEIFPGLDARVAYPQPRTVLAHAG